MLEEGCQIGIGAFIVDDEPRIDGTTVPVDGVAVPTQAIAGLVDRDEMPLRKQPGGAETGNSAAHDGDVEPLICG